MWDSCGACSGGVLGNPYWVEGSVTIASDSHGLDPKVLHRKTSWVKFKRVKVRCPVCVVAIGDPLPTIIWDGDILLLFKKGCKLRGSERRWLVAPVSMYH